MTRNDLDPKCPIFTVDETSFTHALTITNYCRFHTIHRIAPSKLHKKWRNTTITIDNNTKNEKKAFKTRKNHHFIAFSQLSKTSDIIASIFFSISLIFNLIQNRSTFLCYRILHYLNKNKRESFCKRLAEKHARRP